METILGGGEPLQLQHFVRVDALSYAKAAHLERAPVFVQGETVVRLTPVQSNTPQQMHCVRCPPPEGGSRRGEFRN